MSDFRFVRISGVEKWVISDPNRAKRPNVGHKAERICPFCVGGERLEDEVFREGGEAGDTNWRIRVVKNKFPFAPIHDIVIHSPDHHKNFEELPLGHVELIFRTYRQRYLDNMQSGQVYIFHNRGIAAGESIPHPHSQIAVIPHSVRLDVLPLDTSIYGKQGVGSFIKNLLPVKKSSETNIDKRDGDFIESKSFLIFCPEASQWSDEVWVAPQGKGRVFGEITDGEIKDLSFCLQRLIHIMDIRHGHEFSFNFYIYPGRNWYLRIVPRYKTLGGFEVGTGVIVNTQDPRATFAFIKEHFFEPDLYKIHLSQQADYWKSV